MPAETTKGIMPTDQKAMDFLAAVSGNLLPMKKPKDHLTMVGRKAGQNVEANRVAGKIFGSKYLLSHNTYWRVKRKIQRVLTANTAGADGSA